jgi:hypothetical protein
VSAGEFGFEPSGGVTRAVPLGDGFGEPSGHLVAVTARGLVGGSEGEVVGEGLVESVGQFVALALRGLVVGFEVGFEGFEAGGGLVEPACQPSSPISPMVMPISRTFHST